MSLLIRPPPPVKRVTKPRDGRYTHQLRAHRPSGSLSPCAQSIRSSAHPCRTSRKYRRLASLGPSLRARRQRAQRFSRHDCMRHLMTASSMESREEEKNRNNLPGRASQMTSWVGAMSNHFLWPMHMSYAAKEKEAKDLHMCRSHHPGGYSVARV